MPKSPLAAMVPLEPIALICTVPLGAGTPMSYIAPPRWRKPWTPVGAPEASRARELPATSPVPLMAAAVLPAGPSAPRSTMVQALPAACAKVAATQNAAIIVRFMFRSQWVVLERTLADRDYAARPPE